MVDESNEEICIFCVWEREAYNTIFSGISRPLKKKSVDLEKSWNFDLTKDGGSTL